MTLYTYNYVSHMTSEACVTLYVTRWPLSYDPVHKLNQQENGQVCFSYGKQPDILYCNPSLSLPVSLLGFKFFRFAHLYYIFSATLTRSRKTRTNWAQHPMDFPLPWLSLRFYLRKIFTSNYTFDPTCSISTFSLLPSCDTKFRACAW